MDNDWDLIIKPKRGLLEIPVREIWRYRDLLISFIKRDIVTVYKQTILGPIWFVFQPIMTMLIYVVVFGNIAGISTDEIPRPLFYLCGIITWNYFADCFLLTSDTFIKNQDVFGKVYFPRLILPMSYVISGLIKFLIQFCLFIGVYIFFIAAKGFEVNIDHTMFLFPLFILLMAIYGLGFGLIFTSLTTKYRDLKFLIQFGVQLVMYASPIIYPASEASSKSALLGKMMFFNPFSHVIEGMRYIFLGKGDLTTEGVLYSVGVALLVLVFGTLIFNKTEKNFIDTV